MSRNKDRLGMGMSTPQHAPTPPQQTQASGEGFSFVVPTEFVELPSKGKFYPANHALHNRESIEIKQMTAKEEDMLTSRSLLRKGVALDRVLESVVLDKSIRPNELLVGDRNAIIVAMRVNGYGSDYATQISCPSCNTSQKYNFNLNELEYFHGDSDLTSDVKDLGGGFFSTVLPRLKATVTFRLLNGDDEKRMMKKLETDRKEHRQENLITSHLYNMIVGVNGSNEPVHIQSLIDSIPSSDARHLRLMYKLTAPNLDMNQYFECASCDHQQELEVPLTADFFWPDR